MRFIFRHIFLFNTVICFIALAAVVFTIIGLGWKPCPMCLIQQLCVLCTMIFSILGLIKNSSKGFSTIVQTAIILIIIIGCYIAADQAYLQYFSSTISDDPTSCGAISNPFLIDATKSLTGTVSSCTSIAEEISGVSLAVYSLIFLICLLVINCVSLFVRIFKK
ncbi:disulfide bond formation protein B [Francisella orientalis]|uniref:Disulfide bond formation protein n=1 Tax=Francisella orientalis TaxID=299583 RepID=A0AAP6X674_9GAMM|nr:disulfide bond formation protein B [Francisella orientalis]AHB98934.1 dihydrofolate synthase [Francisella orientalis LADL 07-285A]AKN86229.1 Disulfide bond formation protein [Francisella orientalis FNO12]AKN87766.1 Disulfide bond formation protein [Francisella orientalis FNO24]AKN89305.1 Disulfide bond formation protein [Francisella orientalis]AKU06064.1 Disulfide bond formation protein [Francisella orientalis]